MARRQRLICASGALAESATGVRFAIASQPGEEKGFAIRHGGEVRGYVNRCPHLGTELDWQPGEFFDVAGLYLVCSTHGAIFQPDTGFCVAGPCHGASLEPLKVRERDGQVLMQDDAAPPIETKTAAP
jgi:nitrite reductase/ring-hydroxylating ferredoxin subunit